MKPAAFRLIRPRNLLDACEALASADDEAKVLAGGQSLVPLMNFRLAWPEVIVDLNGLGELQYLRFDDSVVTVGAMTRQRTVELDPQVRRQCPLLAEVLPFIAHIPIRNRGTVGGSIAHADPASELCAAAVALDADLLLVSTSGKRLVPARDFFLGPYMTVLEPHELLAEVRFPGKSAGWAWAFEEMARRQGDFALAAVACGLSLHPDGTIADARLAYASMAATPVRARETEASLIGCACTPNTFAEAAESAAGELAPQEDLHASREFRVHLAKALTRRALARACNREDRLCPCRQTPARRYAARKGSNSMDLVLIGDSKPISDGAGALWKAIQGDPVYRRVLDVESGTAQTWADLKGDDLWIGQQISPGETLTADGTNALLVFGQEPMPGFEDEFEDWMNLEHVPYLAAVPGVLGARRFKAVQGQPRFFALYDLESPSVLESEDWKTAAVTPWTLRMRTHTTGRTAATYVRTT